MKKSKFTDSQIMEALKRAEAGVAVPETCRELGIARRADSGPDRGIGGMGRVAHGRARTLILLQRKGRMGAKPSRQSDARRAVYEVREIGSLCCTTAADGCRTCGRRAC